MFFLMLAHLPIFFVFSFIQSVFSMRSPADPAGATRDQICSRISHSPSFTVQDFENFLDSYPPSEEKGKLDFLEQAIRADRADLAFCAYKRGFRLDPFSRERHRSASFKHTLRLLALLIETGKAKERAQVFAHGTKMINGDVVPKEVMEMIAEYAAVAVDVSSDLESCYGPPMPLSQALIFFFLIILIAAICGSGPLPPCPF